MRKLSGLLCTLLLLGATPSESSPDWNAVAQTSTVQIVTKDADGSPRDTTIWLAVVDSKGYIRTGSTHWWNNIARDPDVMMRIEGKEYALRAMAVEDAALCQRVEEAFRAKYGVSDRVVGFFFRSVPHIMRLDPRGE
jgi:hypothetical protein